MESRNPALKREHLILQTHSPSPRWGEPRNAAPHPAVNRGATHLRPFGALRPNGTRVGSLGVHP